MATYQDPVQCFAPLEIIERLLEIRAELGYSAVLYVDNSLDLVEFFDAYGFDVYSFSTENEKINYGDYQAQIVPAAIACIARLQHIKVFYKSPKQLKERGRCYF